MKPLFQVGESVVIQSKNYPEFNNRNDVVEQVIDCGEVVLPRQEQDPLTHALIIVNSRFSYILRDNKYRLGNYSTNKLISSWAELSLRKKHKPSDDSFESMMNKLKTPIKGSQKVSEKSS